jgi:CRP-like cAMP-binding protein
LSAPASPRSANRLLAGLPRRERDRLVAACTPVEMAPGEVLCEADAPYRSAYFPLGGCISLLAGVDGRAPMQVGLVGNEGMLGATLSLGVRNAPLRAVVQSGGMALRLDAAALGRALRDCPALRATLASYVYVVLAQLSQSAACTRFHAVEARLSRALLAMQDRARADPLALTHESLSDILGVRRSAVTIAAAELQRRGLIRYVRGRIDVLSRSRLEASSCTCYAAVLRDYAARFAAPRMRS